MLVATSHWLLQEHFVMNLGSYFSSFGGPLFTLMIKMAMNSE